MTIELHSSRYGGRPIGQPTVARMQAQPRGREELAADVRELLQAKLKAGDGWSRVEVILRSAGLERALQAFDRAALLAFTTEKQAGTCSWDAALQKALPFDLEPARTQGHRALLGEPCQGCRKRHRIDDARRLARLEASLTAAAGLPGGRRCSECAGWTPGRPLVASGTPGPSLTGPAERCGTCAGVVPVAPATRAAVQAAARPRRRSIAAARAAGSYRVLPAARRARGR